MSRFIMALILLCAFAALSAVIAKETRKMTNTIFQENMQYLTKTPQIYDCPDVDILGKDSRWYEENVYTPELRAKDAESTVRSIYYDGVPYKGKPTRVFAYLGMPKVPKGKKVPGIVLVHGGGGSAFESWVRLWNARGYAAIAMDTCGRLNKGNYSSWEPNPYGGNPNCGGFNETDLPLTDQWTYQAVSAVVLANSLLRAQKEVDPNCIGITGISWGGYLTCIAASVDDRFKYAAPVYGAGFLSDNSAWLGTFKDMGPEKTAKWMSLWDPSVFLPDAKVPFFWYTGTNDIAYPLDSLQKTYRLHTGERGLNVTINLVHTHGGPGEKCEEIHAFANSFCTGGIPLAQITEQRRANGVLSVKFKSKSKITSAALNFTRDSNIWQERKWESIPAKIEGNSASAAIPEGTRACYINLTDDRNLTVSSEHTQP